MGKLRLLQNPSICKSIKRQHCNNFLTNVVILKSFDQGLKCLQIRYFMSESKVPYRFDYEAQYRRHMRRYKEIKGSGPFKQ